MRFRHESPHAEKQIRRYQLPRWLSALERAAAEREAERVARRAAELALVDWGDLSPAELAFRWLLAHPSEYRAWVAETLVAGGGCSEGERQARMLALRDHHAATDAATAAADWSAMTPAECAYAAWASGKG